MPDFVCPVDTCKNLLVERGDEWWCQACGYTLKKANEEQEPREDEGEFGHDRNY